MSRGLRRRPFLAAGASAAATIMFATTAAWACVPYPYVFVEPRASAPPGAEVTVSGSGFGAESLEVRWKAMEGTLLVKAAGPTFSVPITVPDEPPGLYALLVVSRGRGGEVLGATPAVFDVTGPGGAESAGPPETTAPTEPAPAPEDISGRDGPRVAAAGLGLALFGAGLAAGALAGRRRRPAA